MQRLESCRIVVTDDSKSTMWLPGVKSVSSETRSLFSSPEDSTVRKSTVGLWLHSVTKLGLTCGFCSSSVFKKKKKKKTELRKMKTEGSYAQGQADQ